MHRPSVIAALVVAFGSLAAAAPATAQIDVTGCKKFQHQATGFFTEGENHFKLTGAPAQPVIVDCDDVQLVADEVELFKEQNRLVARGHVVYVAAGNRISADRLEFDTKAKTGTFYDANGTAVLGDKVDRSLFGTQEPYAYFYGELIHKLGPKKFRITRGGFTTCVQPTPRWEITSGSVTLTLEEHAILKNSILKVKGVPVMYLPMFYYPIQEDDRATGFLLPLYGNSTYRGQTISNQFFWAINRSQDLTLAHDWFLRTGQGFGGEYRYVASNSSNGTARIYLVDEHAATFTNNGQEITTPDRRSYELRSSVRQSLPLNTRLSAAVDYFSDVTVQQLYHHDLYQSSLSSRLWNISATSSFAGFTVLGAAARSEYFYDAANSTIFGALPRFNFSRTATRLGRAPVLVGGFIDYSNNLRESRLRGEVVSDQNVPKLDMVGTVRVPFPTFSFLTVNSTLTWNGTRYSRSLVEGTPGLSPVPVFREYFSFGSEVAGPSFVRIWRNQEGRRLKHIIEPRVAWHRINPFENGNRILKIDTADFLIGGSTQIRYGVTSRLLIKPAGDDAVSRNLLTASVQQTYYTNEASSQFDPSYSTSFLGRPPSAYSPISISTSFEPVATASITSRIEYDPIISALQNISLGGSFQGPYGDVNGSFSKRRLATGQARFTSDNLVSAGGTVKTRHNTVGASYGFTYDFGRVTMVQQKIHGYYNAQCCGIGFEYQEYNYPVHALSRFLIPQDRRFNISFSLAGIGSFSNFLGAMTGQPTRR